MKPLRVLHTSDLHIGDPTGSHFRGGDPASDPARDLRAVIEAATRCEADLILLAGDVFEHNRVASDVIAAVTRELERAICPVVLLPGNHDPLATDSVYSRLALPPTVRLLRDPEGQSISFPHLDLRVWGRPHTSYSGNYPLSALPPRGEAAWEIAVAHGHWVNARTDTPSELITPEEIAASGRDYVALGHWDHPVDVSSGGVRAAYSGSAGYGHATLVTFEMREGVRVINAAQVAVGAAR